MASTSNAAVKECSSYGCHHEALNGDLCDKCYEHEMDAMAEAADIRAAERDYYDFNGGGSFR